MKILLIFFAVLISASTLLSCTRRVYEPAPAARVEIIPVAPSPRHVWVKGYYVQRHRHYVWRPGHYELNGRRYR